MKYFLKDKDEGKKKEKRKREKRENDSQAGISKCNSRRVLY